MCGFIFLCVGGWTSSDVIPCKFSTILNKICNTLKYSTLHILDLAEEKWVMPVSLTSLVFLSLPLPKFCCSFACCLPQTLLQRTKLRRLQHFLCQQRFSFPSSDLIKGESDWLQWNIFQLSWRQNFFPFRKSSAYVLSRITFSNWCLDTGKNPITQ